MADSPLPTRVTINDEHLIERLAQVQRARRYKTAAKCAERLLIERLAQLEYESIQKRVTSTDPQSEARDARAGAVNHSRRTRRSA